MPSSDGAVQNSHVVHAQPCLVGYIDYVGLIYYQRSQMRNCRVTFSEECGDYVRFKNLPNCVQLHTAAAHLK